MPARAAVAPGQLDLLTAIDAGKREAPAPSLFGSPARGLPAREAEIARWREEHGAFGSLPRSHAWTAWLNRDNQPTARCQPIVLHADLRCHHHTARCYCAGDLLYRGACRACAWEGEPHDRENPAAEDACDHAWPGWRDLPAVPEPPADRKALARWTERVTAAYPPGWLEAGGPIRTRRTHDGNRHVPGHTPHGGYDLAAGDTQ